MALSRSSRLNFHLCCVVLPFCKNNLRSFSLSCAADDSQHDGVALDEGKERPNPDVAELPPAGAHVAGKLSSIFKYQHFVSSEVTINPSPAQNVSVSLETGDTDMLASGCKPTALSFNQLMSIYVETGGMVKVLQLYDGMKTVGVQPTEDTYNTVIDAMWRCGDPTRAHNMLADMLGSGWKPNTPTFNKLMSVHAKTGRMEEALQLYDQMKMAGIQPNACSYNIVINALCSCDKITRAQDAFDEMLYSGCKPNADTFVDLMLVHLEAWSTEKVMQLYNQMKTFGIQPNVYTYNIVIDALCRCGKITCALNKLVEMLYAGFKPNEQTFANLMWVHLKSGRMVRVLQLYKQMTALGILPDEDTCNFVIEALCRRGRVTHADDNLDDILELLSPGCMPSTDIFFYLMRFQLEAGRTAVVLQLYKLMKTLGITPNVQTYNTVIKALCSCGRITRAHNKFVEMLNSGCKPNAITFFELMFAHLNAGRTEKGLQLYKQMKTFGIRPDEYTCNFVVNSLCSCSNITRAHVKFVEMVYSECKPSVDTFFYLMRVHFKAGRMEKVLQLYKQMKALGIRPNVRLYNTVIDALCFCGKITLAHDKLVEMLYSGCKPNVDTFFNLMLDHIKAGRTKKVLQLYKLMRTLGVRPDEYTCYFVIEMLCRRGQITLALAEMLDSGEPDVMTYNLLIYTLCLNNNPAMAIKVLKTMIKNGCEPNPWSFNPIFVCDACNGDINSAYRLFLRMKQAKCRPNTDTYNILLQILEESKSADMVVKMWKEMVEWE